MKKVILIFAFFTIAFATYAYNDLKTPKMTAAQGCKKLCEAKDSFFEYDGGANVCTCTAR